MKMIRSYPKQKKWLFFDTIINKETITFLDDNTLRVLESINKESVCLLTKGNGNTGMAYKKK